MGPSKSLTSARLKELLLYSQDSGYFLWICAKGRCKAGSAAGNINQGRLTIKIDGQQYKAHRLAFLYVNGFWPKYEVDHIDGNALNNKFSNLRDVPHVVNTQNLRAAKSHSSTGILGVIHERRTGRYTAAVVHEGVRYHLGTFQTAEDASRAYVDAKRSFHVGCNI